MGKKKTQEESIMELYEKYLTDDLIEISIREKNDEEEDLDDQSKISVCNIEDLDCIPIGKYLNRYLLLDDLDYSKQQVTHSEVKRFESPYVVTVDNRFAEQNPERVGRGEILVVKDSKGVLKSYINPECIKNYLEFNDSKKVMLAFFKRGIRDLELLQEYWSQSVIIKHELENNQSFLELLMDTNRVKNVNKIKHFMNKMKEVELDNASSEAGYMMRVAQDLLDALKDEVYQLSLKEVDRIEFDSSTMKKVDECRRYSGFILEKCGYQVLTDEGVSAFDGEIIEQAVVFKTIPVQEMIDLVKEGMFTLAETVSDENRNVDELRESTVELKNRVLSLKKIKEGEDKND